MLELIEFIAVAAIAATFFSDILSRIVKAFGQMRRSAAHDDVHAQPAH